MDRRHFLGLTGTSITALLGGCSSSGEQSTATATDTATTTATATSTRTKTGTETSSDQPTDTVTSTPEPKESFQSIYDDALEELGGTPSIDDSVLEDVNTDDWSGRDLEQVAVSAAKNSPKNNYAMEIGKAVAETFSTDVDELYVDSRGVVLGGWRNIVKIFDKRNSEVHYLVPWASETNDGHFYRDGEKIVSDAERDLAGLEDSKNRNSRPTWETDYHSNDWPNYVKGFSDIWIGEMFGEKNITFTEGGSDEAERLELKHPEASTEHIEFIHEDYKSIDLDEGQWRAYHFEEGDEDEQSRWVAKTIDDYSPEQGYAEV